MLRFIFFVFAVIIILSVDCLSDTISVPADYPTIQQAIDAAVNGDTVLVAPGTYVENIDFMGKAIAVVGHKGSAATTIDGCQLHSVVCFLNNESTDSILKGFTVTNGKYWQGGGGIRCVDSSPTITDNILYDNSFGGSGCRGGGIYTLFGSPVICNNRILDNELGSNPYIENQGGGIYISYGSPLIEGNLIAGNIVHGGEYAPGMGGGIYCANDTSIVSKNIIEDNRGTMGGGMHLDNSQADVSNNMIIGNYGDEGGGIDIRNGSSALFVNNDICYNHIYYNGGGVVSYGSSSKIINTIMWGNDLSPITVHSGTLDVTYSTIQFGWPGEGNSDKNPLFVDPANRDFHLTFNSPCRASGNNSVVTELTDFEGDPRIYQGTVDIGADEFYTHLYVTGDKTPGGAIKGKFVGLPGTTPVGLFIGSGALPSPMPTMWGDYWLQAPWILLGLLGAIPSDGVMVLPTTLPPGMTVPVDIPMQALIGLNADSLSNLCVLEVR